MERLKSTTKWNLLVPMLKTMCNLHIIIQSTNVNSLSKYQGDIQNDYNLQSSYILCFQETKVKLAQEISQFINTSKYSYMYTIDKHRLLIIIW